MIPVVASAVVAHQHMLRAATRDQLSQRVDESISKTKVAAEIVARILTTDELDLFQVRRNRRQQRIRRNKVEKVIVRGVLAKVVGRVDIKDVVWRQVTSQFDGVSTIDTARRVLGKSKRNFQKERFQRIGPQSLAVEVVKGTIHIGRDNHFLNHGGKQKLGLEPPVESIKCCLRKATELIKMKS